MFCLSTPTQALDPYYGLDETAAKTDLKQTEVSTVIANVISTALTLIGLIFFILMVYGGFLWMTAHGDSGQVDKAKDTITTAIIGIIIVLASYSLTIFVFRSANAGVETKADVGGGGNVAPCEGTGPEQFAPGEVQRGQDGADLGTPNLGVSPCPPRINNDPNLPFAVPGQ